MTTRFPDLCPNRRDFAPGEFATQRFKAINGAGTTRLYGSQPFDSKLNLEFTVNDDGLQDILNCWQQANGAFDDLSLPAQVWAGTADPIQGQIGDSLNWRWAERPSVSSLSPGRSRVQVQLIATLDNA